MIGLFLAAGLALPDHEYYASGTSANVLLPTCANRPANRADFCEGYILSNYDLLSRNELICPGAGVTNAQIIAISLKYMNERPETWAKDAGILIEQALTKAFPCSR